jgi:hypothetical protein
VQPIIRKHREQPLARVSRNGSNNFSSFLLFELGEAARRVGAARRLWCCGRVGQEFESGLVMALREGELLKALRGHWMGCTRTNVHTD